MRDESYMVILTKKEARYLLDAVPLINSLMEREEAETLLLKLGAAFLGTDAGEETAIAFTQRDLWVLKEVTKTAVTVGDEPVGMNLMRRIMGGLIHLSAQTEVHTAVTRLGDGGADRDYGDVKTRVAGIDWKKVKRRRKRHA